MTLSLHIPNDNGQYRPVEWFALSDGDGAAKALGFRFAPGGVHLTKTMMLAELTTVLDKVPDSD
jgi:hypothetical protein